MLLTFHVSPDAQACPISLEWGWDGWCVRVAEPSLVGSPSSGLAEIMKKSGGQAHTAFLDSTKAAYTTTVVNGMPPTPLALCLEPV